MHINPESNLPVNLNLSQDRLELTQTEHLPDQTQEVSEIIFKEQPREERSVKAKAYNRWNILHHIQIGLKQSILVNLNGTQVLINVGSIKARTGLNEQQIFQTNQLIQDITRELARRCIQNPISDQSPESSSNSLSATLSTTSTPERELTAPSNFTLEPASSEAAASSTPATSESELSSAIPPLSIHLENRPRGLGKGTFGKAVEIITAFGKMVAKYSRKRTGDEGTQDVAKEYENHQRFFADNQPVYGVQIPYHSRTLTCFPRKHGEGERAVEANIGHSYNRGDYFSLVVNEPLTFQDSAAIFHQLFHSLHAMEQRGVTHEDIKPENIFVDNVNGGLATDVADLASLQFDGDLIPANIHGTINYIPSTDVTLLVKLTEKAPRFKDKNEKEYINLPEKEYAAVRMIKGKRDVFATGATMYITLTGRYPYALDQYGFAIPTPYQDIPNVPRELNDLLRRMLTFSSVDRIGRTEAWEEFNKILDQYPEFKTRVEANMAAIGRAPSPIA